MGGSPITTVGGIVMIAGIVYFLRLLWRKNKRTSVRDKVVLITGASSGLGEACAHVFYQAGAKVILAARRLPELERVANDLRARKDVIAPHDPKVVHLDLEDLGSIPHTASVSLAFHGHVDILINNGGISYRGQVSRTSLAVDVKVMTINYFGQVALTKAILPSMMIRHQGHIVGISSIQGKIAIPYRSPYAASKHALQAFLDSMRSEVAHCNVQVTTISPAYIRTNLSVNAVNADGSRYGVQDSTTMSGMSPTSVATHVLDSVMHGDRDVIVAPLMYRMAVLIRTLFPQLFFRMMLEKARKHRQEMDKNK